MEKLITANGVELCTETFGSADDAPVLLIGNTMLTWPDAFCQRLAALRRFVVRYDLRDTGRSTAADRMAIVFAALDCGERWRGRLPEITAPTLVVHGEDDPFFPLGNAEALAAEIPRAELVVLPRTGSGLPRRTWNTVVPALVRHTS